MIYQQGLDQYAHTLFSTQKKESTLIQTSNDISSGLPLWSTSKNNILYFLYDQYKPRFIGKVNEVGSSNESLNTSQIIMLSQSILQQSGILEYHSASSDGVEYLFIKQKNSPGEIYVSKNSSNLFPLQDLDKWIDSNEDISSFSLADSTLRIILCKGQDKFKNFLLGELNLEDYEAEYQAVQIPKTNDGVLQEPSFNPSNTDMIAYLEMVRNNKREIVYQLFLQNIGTNRNIFLSDKIYRNENNKTSKPNSTSYVWHPSGNYIFFINTDIKRKIAYVDLTDLSNPKIELLKTDIEFAEQLAISPNGQYLAVMTQISNEKDDSDALGQLFIITLD